MFCYDINIKVTRGAVDGSLQLIEDELSFACCGTGSGILALHAVAYRPVRYHNAWSAHTSLLTDLFRGTATKFAVQTKHTSYLTPRLSRAMALATYVMGRAAQTEDGESHTVGLMSVIRGASPSRGASLGVNQDTYGLTPFGPQPT